MAIKTPYWFINPTIVMNDCCCSAMLLLVGLFFPARRNYFLANFLFKTIQLN